MNIDMQMSVFQTIGNIIFVFIGKSENYWQQLWWYSRWICCEVIFIRMWVYGYSFSSLYLSFDIFSSLYYCWKLCLMSRLVNNYLFCCCCVYFIIISHNKSEDNSVEYVKNDWNTFYLCSIHLWLDQTDYCEVFIGEQHLEIHEYDKYNYKKWWQYNFALIEVCESLKLI